MKLWLFERTDRVGYDEYIGDVVCAETEDDARKLSNVGFHQGVKTTLLGEVSPEVALGVVLDSFNAG